MRRGAGVEGLGSLFGRQTGVCAGLIDVLLGESVEFGMLVRPGLGSARRQ
jgi:hypothetical protein